MTETKASAKTKAAEVEPPAEPEVEAAAAPAAGQCVVDDGTAHQGRAVNGLVCSRHANRYRADGSPR